jgi:RND family efflux transporter MFP subunit
MMCIRSLCLLGPLVALCACSPRADEAGPVETAPLVRTFRVERATVPEREFPGLLSANRTADIAFEVSGVVATVLVETGSRVEAGTPLARLDARDFESRVQAARAEATRARGDAERAQTLLAQEAIAPARAEALVTAALAAEAALQQAQKALEDTVVKAPFAGIVAARFVDAFESVQPKAVAFRVYDLTQFTVAIDLPQALVLASQHRRTADIEAVRFTSHFNAPGAAEEGYPLTVGTFSADPDPRTGSYRFELKLPPPEGLFVLPGMSCRVRIAFDEGMEGAVRVPPAAVGTDASGSPIVWVLDAEGRVRPQPVDLGEPTADGLIVERGVATGDVVVTSGLGQLTAGTLVRPL